jgi:peptidoglycan/LPS O-acetylase OafA/YrhL
VLFSLVALIPSSLLLYRLVERPFIRLGDVIGDTGGGSLTPIASSIEISPPALQAEQLKL